MLKKILVTDGAQFMRSMLRGILIENEYAVYEASNGQEAVDQYAIHQPDLVLMDISMPVMDGIEATKAIKELNPNAVIVMCSEAREKEMILECVHAGAKDFIVKPFQPDRVIQCVKKLVA